MLGEVAGGSYQDLLPFANRVSGYGCEFLVVDLDKLIELKARPGAPKTTK